MTVHVIPEENRVEIRCDTCGRAAPSADEILKAHGLIRLGWHCAGGTHICPTHSHPEGATLARYGK